MPSNPFAELASSLVQASTGFAREEGAFRRDVFTALTSDVTADAIVRLVASHGDQFSVFSEEWENW